MKHGWLGIAVLLFLALAPPTRADAPQGCTTLILNGPGWAILVKNSDTDNNPNEIPIRCPSKSFTLNYATSQGSASKPVTTHAYVGCNSYTMSGARFPFSDRTLETVVWGMNTQGLAAAYTMMTNMPTEPEQSTGLGTRGRELCTIILALYSSVDAVLADINNPDSPIGPHNRRNTDSISVIDKWGNGAVIEVSATKAVYTRVSGLFPEDNLMRMWDLNDAGQATTIRDTANSGPRTQYILESAQRLAQITPRNVAQQVARYIHDKEDATAPFSVDESGKWEICNGGTSSSMVASTDPISHILWGCFGNNPICGVYLPYLPEAEAPMPSGVRALTETNTAQCQTGGLYDPAKVRATQTRAFAAEEYATNSHDLAKLNPTTDLAAWQADTQQQALEIYQGETPPLTLDLTTLALITLAILILTMKR